MMNPFSPLETTTVPLSDLLSSMLVEAKQQSLSRKTWAENANVPPETLSRLFKRNSCDFSTLAALATALQMHIVITPTMSRDMPSPYGRDEEEALLKLCQAKSIDLRAWREIATPYFMAGLAVLLSGEKNVDRDSLLFLAKALYPSITDVNQYQHWLNSSPLKPTRFLAMLRAARTSETN